MTKKYRMIVFDFDGTVADSMGYLEELAVKLLVKYVPQRKPTDLRYRYVSTTGLPFVQQVDMIIPEIDSSIRKQIVKEFEYEKEHNIMDQPLFPDTADVFNYLSSKGYQICISSSTIKELIEPYFEKNHVRHFLTDICGYRIGFEKGKDHFNYLMQKYQVTADEMIFIGDSLKDKERAILSKIPFIARLGLFKKEDFTQGEKCFGIINNLTELKKTFK